LQSSGTVIYLQASVYDLWQRTRHDKNRPLLQTHNPHAKLAELFEQRDALYQQTADVIVQTGKQSVHSLTLHLIEKLESFTTEQLRLINE
jgi:shikimate kinase